MSGRIALPPNFRAGHVSFLTRARWKLIQLLSMSDAIMINIDNSVIRLDSKKSLFLCGCNNEIHGDDAALEMIQAVLK